MIEGVSGSLVSHHYAEHLLGTAFAGRLGERSRGSCPASPPGLVARR